MGICVGWTITQDISQKAWDAMRHDFILIASSYDVKLREWNEQERSRRGLLMRLLSSDVPAQPFDIQVNSDDALKVAPGLGPSRQGINRITPDNQEWYAWQVDRRQGEGWCKTNAHYNDQLLFAALMLLEKHAPKSVVITQNDYDFDVFGSVRKWVKEATNIQLPKMRHARIPSPQERPPSSKLAP